ncbi:Release factor glutamine methyltransferase [Picochlorum sp. SENEW3]|nr:Release factor glutamine methyltransferase [Picochlorum sp. SENEW3]WPT18359.1 Release factor glutamine methyltransferase [Picochlorum sp. SENEW3]
MISLCRSRLFKTVAQHSRSACLSSTPGSVELGRIQASSNPQLPLCERSAEYIESAATVSKWYREVSNSLVQVGDELQKDGGPMYDDLVTELGWLMEDAVVGWKEFAASQERKMACAGSGKSREDAMLKLRISIVELRELWEKRIVERVPLQYLTCSAFWRDMVLSVGPGVLIPRPETELMIDFVQHVVENHPHLASGEWVDLGTGSGALAVGMARAMPAAQVIATDLAPEPLRYASFNATRYKVFDRVDVIESNWFDGLHEAGISNVAGILSNPPYIPAQDVPALQAEVALHEPRLALDGGSDLAIDSLMPICRGAAEILQPGGFIGLETGGGEQAHYVSHVLEHLSAFHHITIRRDLRGVERFISAFKK